MSLSLDKCSFGLSSRPLRLEKGSFGLSSRPLRLEKYSLWLHQNHAISRDRLNLAQKRFVRAQLDATEARKILIRAQFEPPEARQMVLRVRFEATEARKRPIRAQVEATGARNIFILANFEAIGARKGSSGGPQASKVIPQTLHIIEKHKEFTGFRENIIYHTFNSAIGS